MISVSIELTPTIPGPAPALTLSGYEPTSDRGGVLVSVDVPVLVNYKP